MLPTALLAHDYDQMLAKSAAERARILVLERLIRPNRHRGVKHVVCQGVRNIDLVIYDTTFTCNQIFKLPGTKNEARSTKHVEF